MNRDETEDTTIYRVVVNHEEQYSIWPDELTNAPGWHDAGMRGSKARCLDYVKDVWTDMRPLSLRRAMAATTGGLADRSQSSAAIAADQRHAPHASVGLSGSPP